jgi:hypothetical protein
MVETYQSTGNNVQSSDSAYKPNFEEIAPEFPDLFRKDKAVAKFLIKTYNIWALKGNYTRAATALHSGTTIYKLMEEYYPEGLPQVSRYIEESVGEGISIVDIDSEVNRISEGYPRVGSYLHSLKKRKGFDFAEAFLTGLFVYNMIEEQLKKTERNR